MKRLLRQGGLWLLLFFCWLPAAKAQLGTEKIAKIIVTNIGPQVASSDLVRAHIRVKEGDVYNAKRVNDDIPDLYGTGFFANIVIQDAHSAAGVTLTYILYGKQRVSSIAFEGNKRYSNSKLQRQIKTKLGDPVDERTMFNDTQEIEKLYEKAGRGGTRVRSELVNIDQAGGRAGVLFKISETPKVKIVEITFTGAKAFTQKKLRGVIKTGVHWMFSWITQRGFFKEDEFDEDPDLLREFYQKAGYIDFEILRTNIVHPTSNTMTIEFVVSEGQQYKVGSVTFKGNKLFTTEQLIAGIKAQHEASRSKIKIGEHGLEADVGMIFKPDAHKDDVKAVEDFYGAKGYLDVRQGSDKFKVTRIPNTETGTMDIEFQIEEGQKSFIEKIEIRGNIKTKDKVIRRELTVAPGDVFDMVRVQLSQKRLEGLEFFDKVDLVPEADPTLIDRKNLMVAVEEKPTATFSVGATYNTVESLAGFVRVEQANFDLFNPPYFTGAGQKFRLYVSIGTQSQNYQVDWVEPWFLNRHLSFSVSGYRSEYDFQSLGNLYDEARTGFRLGLSKALGSEFLVGSVNYNLEQVDIFNVNTNAPNTILRESGGKLLSRVGGSLSWDSRNDVRLPDKGTLMLFNTSLTGGDQSYLKMELTSAWYFKGLSEGHVLEVVGRGGVAQKLGSQDLPFYDRFYLGGLRDLRGYDYRAIGPREVYQDGSNYEPIGGDTYWMGSLEYSVPIVQFLRFAMFYDIGNVSAKPWSNQGFDVAGKQLESIPGSPPGFSQFHAGNTGGFSDDFGFGIHLNIPRMPLRIDYGIPLHHDPFSPDHGKIQIGVGFTRPL